MRLPWYEIWDDFDVWYKRREDAGRCSKCNHWKLNAPEWEDQKKAIERLVEKSIKELNN